MSRRVKKLRIDAQALFNMVTDGVFRIENGIPKGSQFRGFSHDWSTNTINIFIEHESFPEVPPQFECECLEPPIITPLGTD